VILLPQLPECWDYRHTPSHLTNTLCFLKYRRGHQIYKKGKVSYYRLESTRDDFSKKMVELIMDKDQPPICSRQSGH
jgi:hypothetical protein